MKLPTTLVTATLSFATIANAQTATPPMGDMPADPNLPTLWLIGDSTVRVGTPGQMGWGDPIKAMFDSSKINVVNRAIGGRSSRTFRTDGRWEAILEVAKPGDFVIMQFGHNDAAALAGDNRERGTIRSNGDETETVTLTLGDNKGKQETVHSYGWYLRQYVTEAKEKGLTPIVCSYIPRAPRRADDKRPAPRPTTQSEKPSGMSSYQLWAKEAADQSGAAFIDLLSIVNDRYAQETPEAVKEKYFTPADDTHTGPGGAKLNAECVVEGLKRIDSPLVAYLAK